MDDADRHAFVQQLGQAMSNISEECYCAGWLGGTEYFVPELCRRAVETVRTQYWGHGEVTPDQARELITLAERAGCWADTDYYSVGYEPFQPFPIPPEYLEAIEREQSSEYARRRQNQAEPHGAPDTGREVRRP
jgi:hypothetical protein